MLIDIDASPKQKITFSREQLQSRIEILNDNELQRIEDFLLGSIRVWRKARPNEWFYANTLFGGINRVWEDTPLNALVEHYRESNDEDSVHDRAGIALGYILKSVLARQNEFNVHTRRRFWREYLIIE